MARVRDDGGCSDAFPVTSGVKQRCVLAPTLFIMVFTYPFHDSEAGIRIRYGMHGKLFNQRRLQAVTNVKETVLRDLLFADDCALNAGSEPEMQLSMDTLCSACDNFGLTISTKKTNRMHQPAPNIPYLEPSMYVKGQNSASAIILSGALLSSRAIVLPRQQDLLRCGANVSNAIP